MAGSWPETSLHLQMSSCKDSSLLQQNNGGENLLGSPFEDVFKRYLSSCIQDSQIDVAVLLCAIAGAGQKAAVSSAVSILPRRGMLLSAYC